MINNYDNDDEDDDYTNNNLSLMMVLEIILFKLPSLLPPW